MVPSIAAPAESIPGTGGDKQPAYLVGNPFSLESAFSKLDSALNEVISAVEGEESRVGSSAAQENLVSRFKSWRAELVALRRGSSGFSGTMRAGAGAPSRQEGGLFVD